MNKSDFQRLAEMRIAEAQMLLTHGQSFGFAGAYYLAGYAVECALKACIAKSFRDGDFPPRIKENEYYTHSLTILLKTADLLGALEGAQQTNQNLEFNWSVVKDWSEEARYDVGITESQARDMVTAVSDSTDGVLIWLKNHW